LSLKGQRTTASYTDAIDHIAVSPGLKNYWVKDSVFAFYANAYIGSFSTNTSDHFPVFTRFYMNEPNLKVKELNSIKIHPYFADNHWNGVDTYLKEKIKVYNSMGQIFFEGYFSEFTPHPNCLFVIHLEYNGQMITSDWIAY
jgi:hypothetical protein